MKYVIVGSGVAGIAAIEAIRTVDGSGEITLIGNDPHGHYSRKSRKTSKDCRSDM